MKKKVMLVGLITILSVGIITSYKQENKTKEVEYDSNTMAVYVKDNNGIYQKESSFPTSGYKLNTTKSVCTNGVIPVWSDNSLKLNNLTNTTSCYLYFDEMVAKDTILANKVIDNSRSSNINGTFTENTTSTETTKGKIFSAEDDDGTSYVYAGVVNDNWVKFGQENGNDLYWRIIRINGDGTIRLIYNGTNVEQTGVSTMINNMTDKFNPPMGDNAYMGYMYGQIGGETYAATHANTTSSYAKDKVDEWYNTNLNKAGIKEHIDTNAGFCGDREVVRNHWDEYSGYGYGDNIRTLYGPGSRLIDNSGSWKNSIIPSLKCTNSNNDLYTVKEAAKGNKALTYPVGLITSDEVVIAGGIGGTSNTSFYLYTGQAYWTMSPMLYDAKSLNRIVIVNSVISNDITNNYGGYRPVINLKADTVLTGNGTTTTPYEVVG